jgi:RNA polymerase sigma factor (sigma-70 family)
MAGETAAAVGAAQAEYYRQHKLFLLKLAVALCGDVPLAEDLVQETFIKLFRRWPEHVAGQPFRDEYAAQTLKNCCIDAFRRRQVRPREVGDALELVEDVSVAGPPSAVDAVTDVVEEVRAAIRMLPERQQMVIFLAYYAGWGLAEVAEYMNIGPKTVHNYHSLAKQRLARMLSHLDRTEGQRDER